MNILIYTHAFAPRIGGVETYVMLLAQGLVRDTANQSPTLAETFPQPDIRVIVATSTPAEEFDDTTLPFQVVRQPDVLTLWRLIGQSTVIQLAGPVLLPLCIALLQRKPVAIEHHGYQVSCPNGLLLYEPTRAICPGHFMARRYHQCLRCNAGTAGWLKSLILLLLTFPRRWMCQLAAANCPITRHVKERLRLPHMHVIYYGIPDPVDPAAPASSNAHRTQPLCFAYVGRLTSEKGLPLLLQSVRQLKDLGYTFHLKFIGDGPERVYLESMAATMALQECTTFTGFLTGTALQAAVNNVAAVVMPSVWEETAGLSAIEQMMRGRLVIVANIGGLGEVVDTAGLRFPPGDVNGLVACMQQVLDDPGLVQRLGQTARARALQIFRQQRMVDDHISLYARVAAISFQ